MSPVLKVVRGMNHFLNAVTLTKSFGKREDENVSSSIARFGDDTKTDFQTFKPSLKEDDRG